MNLHPYDAPRISTLHREFYQQRFEKLQRRCLYIIGIVAVGFIATMFNKDLLGSYLSGTYLLLIFGYLMPVIKTYRQYLEEEKAAHNALIAQIHGRKF